MSNKKRQKISLGFTDQKFDQGVHICQIISSDEERDNAVVNFLVSGLDAGESTACFTGRLSHNSLIEFLNEKGISVEKLTSSGDLIISETKDAYFGDGQFIPERMLDVLREFYQECQRQNKPGARVIGEMTPEIESVAGGSRLLEYESRVSMLLREYPVTTVCQYDAREFDGSTIMDILKVHPYMIVNGSVVHNPFYVQPEKFLAANLK
jgi:hypothetical protein